MTNTLTIDMSAEIPTEVFDRLWNDTEAWSFGIFWWDASDTLHYDDRKMREFVWLKRNVVVHKSTPMVAPNLPVAVNA
jgi:hypothetical protein